MMKATKNIGASVMARLLRAARERGEDFQLVLTRYANERLLFRLASSRHGAQFVLKGATLFTLWTGQPHRPTRDVDLLGFGEPSERRLRDIFSDVIALGVEDDGVSFDAATLEVGPIREDQAYGGIRVVVVVHLASSKTRVQIDVGFGDVITPEPVLVDLPVLLDFPAPRMRAYPRETVVAEKLEAMVQLGIANSRMKDFHDVATISRLFEFDGDLLVRALRATFARRKTPLPIGVPTALTDAFADDPAKNAQWATFSRKLDAGEKTDLRGVLDTVARFALRPLEAASSQADKWRALWPAGGPWRE
jgi:predicted nucleotidyltransferase component of viral defense system